MSAALSALLIGSFMALVTAYPTGAPDRACVSLMPGHDPSTGTDPSPFSVIVDPAWYAPGDDITVTISTSGVAFRGFIIQARKTGETTPYGTFKDAAATTKLLTCTGASVSSVTGNSWTHSDRSDKTSVTATWTAPDSVMGTLAFQATVVQQNIGGVSIFYQNIMSEELMYNGPTGMSPTTKDGGVGMVRGSLLVTVVALLTMALVTRRL